MSVIKLHDQLPNNPRSSKNVIARQWMLRVDMFVCLALRVDDGEWMDDHSTVSIPHKRADGMGAINLGGLSNRL